MNIVGLALPFDFEQPMWLWLVLLVPVLIAASLRSLAGLEPVRRVLALIVRSLLVILIAEFHSLRPVPPLQSERPLADRAAVEELEEEWKSSPAAESATEEAVFSPPPQKPVGSTGEGSGVVAMTEAASLPLGPPPVVEVHGIADIDGSKMAILNGRIVFEGDDIDGMTVLSIDRQEVTLLYGGKRRVVRLR